MKFKVTRKSKIDFYTEVLLSKSSIITVQNFIDHVMIDVEDLQFSNVINELDDLFRENVQNLSNTYNMLSYNGFTIDIKESKIIIQDLP